MTQLVIFYLLIQLNHTKTTGTQHISGLLHSVPLNSSSNDTACLEKRMIIKKERGLPFIFRYVAFDVNLSYRQHKPFQVPLSGRA